MLQHLFHFILHVLAHLGRSGQNPRGPETVACVCNGFEAEVKLQVCQFGDRLDECCLLLAGGHSDVCDGEGVELSNETPAHVSAGNKRNDVITGALRF